MSVTMTIDGRAFPVTDVRMTIAGPERGGRTFAMPPMRPTVDGVLGGVGRAERVPVVFEFKQTVTLSPPEGERLIDLVREGTRRMHLADRAEKWKAQRRGGRR